MFKIMFIVFCSLLASMIIIPVAAVVSYEEAIYLQLFESRLRECWNAIGFFSCANLGGTYQAEQDCTNAMTRYDTCLKLTCYDAEYIAGKSTPAPFDYTHKYAMYATVKSAECLADENVIKYMKLSQSTENYLQEYQHCYQTVRSDFDPAAHPHLTTLFETLHTCAIGVSTLAAASTCDSKCKDAIEKFNTCVLEEEKKFTIKQSFWHIGEIIAAFKKTIVGTCATSMKQEILASQDLTNHVSCVQTRITQEAENHAANIQAPIILFLISMLLALF